MINHTKMRVPKKYEHMIEEIIKDVDGYWIHLAEGFYSPDTGAHTIHEETQKDALACIRNIKEETYCLKSANGKYTEMNMTFEEAVERFKTVRIYDGEEMHSRQTGSNVERIWDIHNLKRNPEIVKEELEQEVERLEKAITEENRKDLEQEIERIHEGIRTLLEEIEARRRSQNEAD